MSTFSQGNQHVVENRDSVVLVEPAGQRKVERARCYLLVRGATEAGYDNEILLVNEIAANEFPDPRGFDVIIPLGATLSAYEPALLQTLVGAEMAMLREADRAGVPVLGVCFGGQLLTQAHAAESVARIGLKSVVTPSKAIIGVWCPKVLGFSGITTNGRTHPEPPKSQETATPLKPSSCAALSLCSSIRSCTVTF